MSTSSPDRVILFVALPRAMGGSNRSLASLMTAFRPHIGVVLASPAWGSFRQFVEERNVVDEYLPLPSGGRLQRVLASLLILRWARFNRHRIVAIHAQALTGLNLAVPAAIFTRLPVVVRVSDAEGSTAGRVLGPIIRRLVPDLRVLAVSETARDLAVANGLCRIEDVTVVPNPVDPEDVVAHDRSPGGETLTVGFLGGITHRKGFDLLPTVVEATLDLPIQWLLFLPASTDQEFAADLDSLHAYPEERVSFRKRESDVRRVYVICDIVFVPSRAESFCRVVAEAMANGIGVVASDLDPIQKLLGEEEAGLMFPNGDALRAAEQLRRLVQDAGLRRRLGKRGQERAAIYAPESILRQLAGVYGVSTDR